MKRLPAGWNGGRSVQVRMTVGGAILTLVFAASAVSAARSQTVQTDSASGVPVVNILTRMVEGWHPQLNDPLWLDLRPALETAFDSRPPGVVSFLARRAAARVDVAADPVVSVSAPASMQLDTRPWFELATPLPYFVEIHATFDHCPIETGGITPSKHGWGHGVEIGNEFS